MPTAASAFGAVPRRLWTALLVVLLAAAGIVHASESSDARAVAPSTCVEPRPLPAGTSTHLLTHDGQQRSYQMYVPAGYDGRERLPVLYLFHGLGGSPAKVMQTTAMAALAERENFVVIAPQARGKVAEWDFRSPGSVVNSDVSFVDSLVQDVAGRSCIDPKHTYAAGFSNGSALVLALACDARSRFAGYGAVSGPYMSPSCSTRPASIAYFHGLQDDVVPYTGAATAIGPLPPVDDTIARWVQHDRCPADQASTSVQGAVRHFAWRGCADSSAVSVYVVEDAGHAWPGPAIDATRLMWTFFEQTS